MEAVFTPEELRVLASRASTIDERLAGGYSTESTKGGGEKAAKRLEAWCKAATDGDKVLFSKRLARDGFNIDTVLPLLGDVRLAEDRPLPAWVETFCWTTEAMRTAGSGGELAIFSASDLLLPFEELFTPLAGAARERRDGHVGKLSALLSEVAHTALQRGLVQRLTDLCAPNLYEGFSIFRLLRQPMMTVLALPVEGGNALSRVAYDAYIAEFCAQGIRDYFLNRPVLGRLIATVVQQWINATAELIIRLDADLGAIRQTFGSRETASIVVDIRFGLSDPHNDGRMACKLVFEDGGVTVVYKPKEMGLDVAWSDLLRWLDPLKESLWLKAPTVIKREGYGWAEWIEPAPCEDEVAARRFYNRAGSLLCLVYVLQGTDCHSENVIASNDQLVLVDLETLMHPLSSSPISQQSARSAIATAAKRLRDSVLATGFLPNWMVLPGGRLAGIGGLNPAEVRAFEYRGFQNINTDGMKVSKFATTSRTKSYLPSLRGRDLSSADFRNEVVAGFEVMYQSLLRNKDLLVAQAGPLASFKGQTVRLVLRPTQLYALLLRRSKGEQNLSDGVDWSLHFDFLARFADWEEEDDPAWPVQEIERRALTRLDIPFFTSHTDADQIKVPGTGAIEVRLEPSVEGTARRLCGLSNADLRVQTAYIRQALESAPGRADAEETGLWAEIAGLDERLLTADMAIQAARSVAALLERQAVRDGGGAAWIGAVALPAEERSQLKVIGYDLYSGASGVALFLGAFEHVTGKNNYHDLAMAALAPLREELRGGISGPRLARRLGIGGGVGLGSVIYALVRAASLLREMPLLDDACRVATLITDERIEADRSLDVIAGAAGTILGLLALFSAYHDERLLERARKCGRHLLAMQDKGNGGTRAWVTGETTPLTGFSHGAAGIALSLLRLYAVTGDRDFLAAAFDGIQYERRVFSAEKGNWPDFRDLPDSERSPDGPCRWCHGAAGIGLARLGALDIVDDNATRDEIDAAIQATISVSMASMDHPCCGNFGRLETLFFAGRRLDRSWLVRRTHSRATQLLFRAHKRGGFTWAAGTDERNPGFFTGISGVGYQLLRFTHPELLPSVLLWETS
jgi:type 2 lantibiotic biosynthesis protein LanM